MASTKTEPQGLFNSLHEVQKSVGSISKNATNPHFKNAYLTLDKLMESVLPLLNESDLLLVQKPTFVNAPNGSDIEPALETIIIHVPTGEKLSTMTPLMIEKQNPQGQGSAITYARRYAIVSILGIIVDQDDDGTAGSTRSRSKTTKNVRSEQSVGEAQEGLDAGSYF